MRVRLPLLLFGGLLLSSRACFVMPTRAAQQPSDSRSEWSSYGGSADGIRYSSLTQINRSNVGQLQVAWTYDAGEGPGGTECQPVVARGVLYGVTPHHNVVALDAATGRLIWRFASGIIGSGANRGVAYWIAGNERRVFAAVQHWIYALDGWTGKPIPGFGTNGRIDLREGLGRDPAMQSLALTTPGVVYKNLLIVGGRVPEALPAPPGDIRAYDVRTGKMRWSFHTIPHPGEAGYETWPRYAWKVSGSANNWAGMAVDTARGLVFVPTGSAASDFYGADRVGDNLFANTLLALDANTGKRVWHFQAVKHDIWDRDLPSPPSLVRVKRAGKWVDAVAQTTKSGHVYLFERAGGKPLFPIVYREYPASTVPGEMAARTQSLPVKPAPFARQVLTEDLLTTRTPEAHRWVVQRFRTFHGGTPFVPFRAGQETILFPGFDGGAEYGGCAFDPETGLLYVNANEMAWTSSLARSETTKSGRQLYLRHCANCHGDNLAGSPPQYPSLREIGRRKDLSAVSKIIRQGAGRMPGFPSLARRDVTAVAEYVLSGQSKELQADDPAAMTADYRFTGYHKFLDPEGYPAVAPPWGTLNAINLNTGKYAWKVALGEYPELAAQGLKDTGSENYGGPVVTAGGLVFIAATNYDRKFRAFDKRSGKLLWETTLPMACNGTPAVYWARGRQFVVVCAEGSKGRPSDPRGGMYIAFALPRPPGHAADRSPRTETTRQVRSRSPSGRTVSRRLGATGFVPVGIEGDGRENIISTGFGGLLRTAGGSAGCFCRKAESRDRCHGLAGEIRRDPHTPSGSSRVMRCRSGCGREHPSVARGHSRRVAGGARPLARAAIEPPCRRADGRSRS
jgi:quinoprotein glucose dehydrogenase